MLDHIKAVIFDLDGTLVESMSMWKDIDVEYLEKFNLPVPENLQQDIEALNMYQTAVYFKETFNIPDCLEDIMAAWNEMAFEKYTCEIPLKPGVRPFLEALKKKHIPCGIATTNSRFLTEAILTSHQIHSFFSVIVTGDEITNGKPDPEIYLKAAEKMNVSLGFDSCSCHTYLNTIKNKEEYNKLAMFAEPCESTLFSIYVNSYCEVFPCSFCESENRNGNNWIKGISLLEITDFQKEVWNLPRIKEFRQNLLKNGRKCPMYNLD